jgi:hypothetical protein
MSAGPESTIGLFEKWKSGDAEAGQQMAQRFSDWYFALSSARYGEAASREALERACQLFAQGISSVPTAADLEPWALSLLKESLASLNQQSVVDEPTRLTGNRLPSRLLRRAVAEAECPSLPLLALAWDPSVSEERLRGAAESAGGYPLALLKARQELKQWLETQENIPFKGDSKGINLDYLPLPLYESGRLSESETEAFERWLLAEPDLRTEVAEFSSFSLALRSGFLSELVTQYGPSKSKTRENSSVSLSYRVPESGGWVPDTWIVVMGACVLGIVAMFLTVL